jgi:citrate synthase
MLHSRRAPDGRSSLFDPGEIERLARSRGRGRSIANELWVESSLTAIAGGRCYYRGIDTVVASRSLAFEDVAELLWTGNVPNQRTGWVSGRRRRRVGAAAAAALPDGTPPLEVVRVIAAALATADDLRHDVSMPAVLATCRSLIAGLVECLAKQGEPQRGSSKASIAARLWSALCGTRPSRRGIALLNSALVLLADHELTASTLAARVAASVRADPYSVVLAGLGVVSGPLHGGASLWVEDLLWSIDRPASAARSLGERLRRGERLVPFGHPLYPEGDPRGRELLDRVRTTARSARRLEVVDALLEVAARRSLPPPNVDFALGAVAYCFGMRRGAGETIFAVARTAGWLAHALEEYETRTIGRARAIYVGPAVDSRAGPLEVPGTLREDHHTHGGDRGEHDEEQVASRRATRPSRQQQEDREQSE